MMTPSDRRGKTKTRRRVRVGPDWPKECFFSAFIHKPETIPEVFHMRFQTSSPANSRGLPHAARPLWGVFPRRIQNTKYQLLNNFNRYAIHII